MENREKHKYEYAVDTTADTAPARVVRMIGREQRVLEVGSGPGSITKQLKEAGRCKVTALEIDPVAIELVKPFCEAVYSADLNSSEWDKVLSGQKFEVVLAADVLEHVYNPLAVLKKMASLVTPGGRVVLSLPHVGHCAIATCLLLEDFEYRDWGLLDRTHIRFFGLKNIQDLLQQANLAITKVEFVVRHPEETEFAAKWSQLNNVVQNALLINKFGFVYQVVLEARVMSEEYQSINLFDQPVIHARLGTQTSSQSGDEILVSSANQQPRILNAPGFKNRIGSYMTPGVKTLVRRVASSVGIQL
jgi:2-polyprenyl-3-methyl-5-hydroxy-6-metoxy-1,4-benzoquinol methylase